ncbi:MULTISPECIES: hypothetical protein [unclassified Kitasatospora]|uniref:hypothetical protein n=1 Tax=unclassified Kitasatospora TaxID=2633591 RepID=UPI003400B2DB
MSDHGDATWIGNAQGQTHTGNGTQNNFHYYFGASDRLTRNGGDPLRVALEHRVWLSRRFVMPPGFEDAAAKVKKPGTTVLLSGDSGSGRRTAAVVLLHRAGGDRALFREVSLDGSPDEPSEVATGERVLFDLSGASEREFVEAQRLLRIYRDKVERSEARLAVVLPREGEHLLHSDFRQLIVPIGRPDGDQVLKRHLRMAGIEVPLPELRRSALGKFLGRSPMRELQRLSELVVQASSQGGDFSNWALRAVEAVRDRGGQVAQQISDLADGRQRALLFTAAMLEEAPAATVFRLSDRLLARIGHPEDERPRLDREDLTQRLRSLQVQVRDERIRFDALAYGAAVRTHFWLYYPDLRATFGDWVRDVVRTEAWLAPADRRLLVGRFTEQALRVGDVHVLAGLAESWTEETRLLPEATQVLGEGLTSETWGSEFRRRIYYWSVGPKLEPNLVQVLARVCVDAIAPHYPHQALVRLHHLARRAPEEGARYARDALLELASRDRRLYLRLLDRLCEGLERRTPVRSDADIFLELVGSLPGWVPHTEGVQGWRGVLAAASSPKAWEPGVKSWLSAARRTSEGGRQLMRILTDAADGRVAVLSRYYVLAHEWGTGPDDSPGPVSRAVVVARFCQEIDRAQGIEPLVGATGGRRL